MSETASAPTHSDSIVVIGGSSGIGLGVARAALRAGCEVAVVGRSAERLAEAALALGGGDRLRTFVADATVESDVQRLFSSVGAVDHVIVTAADIPRYGPVPDLGIDVARRVVDSKLIAAIVVAKYAAPVLPASGSLTFTGGIAADRPMPGGAVVAAVNSALVGLVRGLALDLAPVRVNVLAPGWVDTPAWSRVDGLGATGVLVAMAERLPAGRIGRPEDIAAAALFLTRAEMITGAVLPVDGGQRLV